MRLLTILFATLLLVGCPESDSATTEDAAVDTQQGAANDVAGDAASNDVAGDAASNAAKPEDASVSDVSTTED